MKQQSTKIGTLSLGLRRGLYVAAALMVASSTARAVDLDLTTVGAEGTVNGALYKQIDPQSTGTGVLDPFVRLQAQDSEEGYNTSNGSLPFDEKAGIWTHDLQLGSLSVVNVGGTDYYRFELDVNQTSPNPEIDLIELQIYTSATGSQNTTDVPSLGALRYDLDGAGDSMITLDYSLNSGSGSGDMSAYIPVSAFAGATGSDYVYLYSKFDRTNDGFEEWAGELGQAIPEPSAFLLVGAGLGLFGFLRRKHS